MLQGAVRLCATVRRNTHRTLHEASLQAAFVQMSGFQHVRL